MTLARLSSLTAWLVACASFSTSAQESPEAPPPAGSPKETAISVPPPTPSGLLLAWKPTILTVRVDTGTGSHFGSDKLQPFRGLARYTVMAKAGTPFFGRFELEGGQFESDDQGIGSRGFDVAARVTAGAGTRIFDRTLFIASIGAITRYQRGSAEGGAPKLGVFGAMANAELAYRVFPTVTLSLMGEAGVVPFPYAAQRNLGDLSDASEFRARIQLSFDVTKDFAVELGYDFTRWHATFVSSTILSASPGALVLESREYALAAGLRWKL